MMIVNVEKLILTICVIRINKTVYKNTIKNSITFKQQKNYVRNIIFKKFYYSTPSYEVL